MPNLNITKDGMPAKDGEENLRKSVVAKSKHLVKNHNTTTPRESADPRGE